MRTKNANGMHSEPKIKMAFVSVKMCIVDAEMNRPSKNNNVSSPI